MSLTEKRTLSKVSFAIALAMILAIALPYLYNVIQWGNLPDYVYGYRTATGIGVVGALTEPGRRAGLEVGDLIL